MEAAISFQPSALSKVSALRTENRMLTNQKEIYLRSQIQEKSEIDNPRSDSDS